MLKTHLWLAKTLPCCFEACDACAVMDASVYAVTLGLLWQGILHMRLLLVSQCWYLLHAATDGLRGVMARRVIQGQQANSLPLNTTNGAVSAALGHTQGAETTAGVLCDLVGARLCDLTGIPGLLDDNLQITRQRTSLLKRGLT